MEKVQNKAETIRIKPHLLESNPKFLLYSAPLLSWTGFEPGAGIQLLLSPCKLGAVSVCPHAWHDPSTEPPPARGTHSRAQLILALFLSCFWAVREQKQRLQPEHQRDQQESGGQGEGAQQVRGQRQRVGAGRAARAPAQPAQPALCQRQEPPEPPLLRPPGAAPLVQPAQAGLQGAGQQRAPRSAPGARAERRAARAHRQPPVLPEGHGQPLRVLRGHHVRGSAFKRLCFLGLFLVFVGFFWGGGLWDARLEEAWLSCMSHLPVCECVAEKRKKIDKTEQKKEKKYKHPPPQATKMNNKISWDC